MGGGIQSKILSLIVLLLFSHHTPHVVLSHLLIVMGRVMSVFLCLVSCVGVAIREKTTRVRYRESGCENVCLCACVCVCLVSVSRFSRWCLLVVVVVSR